MRPVPALVLALALALALASVACGCEPAPASSVESADAAAPAAWLEFRDGAAARVVERPTSATPGGTATYRIEVAGAAGGQLRVSLAPPRAASREVVPGPGRPAASWDRDDPRVMSTAVPWPAPGSSVTVTLPVPAPFGPTNAVVLLERVAAGDRVVPAVAGSRRRDGAAIVDVLALAAAPARLLATSVADAAAPGAPAIVVDGRLDEPAWAGLVTGEGAAPLGGPAPRSALLVDARSGEWTGEPALAAARTHVAFAWDRERLYVAAWLADRDVWATLTARDASLWTEEVFEVFVAGAQGSTYVELQLNPLGAQFDAAFVRPRAAGPAWDGAWSGAVAVDGVVAEPRADDRGWAAELAVPWAELCAVTQVPCQPEPGDVVRVLAYRLERPRDRSGRRVGGTVGLTLAPPRRPDFHAWEAAAALELLAPGAPPADGDR